VLDTAGITNEIEQFNLNIGLSCAQFVLAISGAMFVDKWGRRNMLMTSMFSISICWIGVVAATSAVAKDAANKSAGSAAVAMIFIFDIVFSFGITPMQALYPVEVLSFEMRAKGMTFSSLAMNAAILINNLAIPVALNNIEWKIYIFYAVWCFVQGIVFYFVLVETRGFTLEELDQIFAERNPCKASLKKRDVAELEAR
jgi:MFS family permease